ncbi:MAG: hypothetical protein EOO41_00450, partial [Methanobacteriota archaeon]
MFVTTCYFMPACMPAECRDEYISYISRLLENDLTKGAAQGTYLLVDPSAVDMPPSDISAAGLFRAANMGRPTATVDSGLSASLAPTVTAGRATSPQRGERASLATLKRTGSASPTLAPMERMLASMVTMAADVSEPGTGSVRMPSSSMDDTPPDSSMRNAKRSAPGELSHELQVAVQPSRTVRAAGDGINIAVLMTEMQGIAVAFRNHTAQVLDDGLREALELDLHHGLNVVEDILPPSLLASMSALAHDAHGDGSVATATSLGTSSIPIVGMDWLGGSFCILAVLCADRRLRIFGFTAHLQHNPAYLRDAVTRRVLSTHMKEVNDEEEEMQAHLVATSVKQRREGLRTLKGRTGKLLHRKQQPVPSLGGGDGEVAEEDQRETFDHEAYILEHMLSANIGAVDSLRDEFDREDRMLPHTHNAS